MVLAILEGRKTQTRRIVKSRHESGMFRVAKNNKGEISGITSLDWDHRPNNDVDNDIKPKYIKDDILWVRESFTECKTPDIPHDRKWKFCYKADSEKKGYGLIKWKPSIHMPKEAARIFLKVTDVRCEKLCSISENDAIAEGVKIVGSKMLGRLDKAPEKTPLFKDYLLKSEKGTRSPVSSFFSLWRKINGSDSYHKNHWVWVYTFEKIEKPENFLS